MKSTGGQCKIPHFQMFTFEKYCDLETRVGGCSKALEMTPLDRLHFLYCV